MSAGQVHAARLNPAKIIDTRPTHSPDWFLDWAFEEAQRLGEGRGHYVLTARTTVDLGMQQAAQDAMVNTLRHTGTEPQARLHRRAGVDGARRRRARHGRRPRLRGQPVQPRRPCAPAAGLLVQALRLCHRRSRTAATRARSCATSAAPAATGRPRTTPAAARGAPCRPSTPSACRSTCPPSRCRCGSAARRCVEMTQRLGVVGVKKTCSMALGDTGITPLQHTGAYAALRQRRQARQALRHPGDVQLQGRPHLLARQRRAAAAAGREPQGRRGHEPDDAGGGDERHAPRRHARLHHRRRQDRHQLRAIAMPGSSASRARW